MNLAEPGRRFIRSGPVVFDLPFHKVAGEKSGEEKEKIRTNGFFFLFSDLLVFTIDKGGGILPTSTTILPGGTKALLPGGKSYKYEGFLVLNDLEVEDVEENKYLLCKFRLWLVVACLITDVLSALHYEGNERETYEFEVETLDDKRSWMDSIREQVRLASFSFFSSLIANPCHL